MEREPVKMRKQPVGRMSPWQFAAEPGDRVYQWHPRFDYAYIYDLRESRGKDKSASGVLAPVGVKKNGQLRRAMRLRTGRSWFWID